MSETLREQQGDHEIADEEDRQAKPDDVGSAHSRSTPLTINAATAKNTTVKITKTRSAMHKLQFDGWPGIGRKTSVLARRLGSC
jgi:hypothetical protein